MEVPKQLAPLWHMSSQFEDMDKVKGKVNVVAGGYKHEYKFGKHKKGKIKQIVDALSPTKRDRHTCCGSGPETPYESTLCPNDHPPAASRTASPPPLPPRGRHTNTPDRSRGDWSYWRDNLPSVPVPDPRPLRSVSKLPGSPEVEEDLEHPDMQIFHSYYMPLLHLGKDTSLSSLTLEDRVHSSGTGERNERKPRISCSQAGSVLRPQRSSPPLPANRINLPGCSPDDKALYRLLNKNRKLPAVPSDDDAHSPHQPQTAQDDLLTRSQLADHSSTLDDEFYPEVHTLQPSNQPVYSRDRETAALSTPLSDLDRTLSSRREEDSRTDSQLREILSKHEFVIPSDAVNLHTYRYNGVGGWYLNGDGTGEPTTQESLETGNWMSSDDDDFSRESDEEYNKMKQLQARTKGATPAGQTKASLPTVANQAVGIRKCTYSVAWV